MTREQLLKNIREMAGCTPDHTLTILERAHIYDEFGDEIQWDEEQGGPDVVALKHESKEIMPGNDKPQTYRIVVPILSGVLEDIEQEKGFTNGILEEIAAQIRWLHKPAPDAEVLWER